MNELELRAYGLVAQAITRHAFAMASSEEEFSSKYPDAPRPIYFHEFMSTFENVASDLVRLGILNPLDQDPGCICFVFNCETSDSTYVAEQNWRQGPTFSELLVTFINLFGDFGSEYWGFSSKPIIPFGAGGRLAATLDALVPLGYLRNTEKGYVWTDRIAPVMLESYEAQFWSDQAEEL